MAKKNEVSDSGYEAEEEERRSKSHKKGLNSSTTSKSAMTSQNKVASARDDESEYKEEEGSSSGEEEVEDASSEAKQDAARGAPKPPTAEGSESEEESGPEEAKEASPEEKEQKNQDASKEAPKYLTSEESNSEGSSSGDEEGKKLPPKKMVLPLIDTPADDQLEESLSSESGDDEEDTEPEAKGGKEKDDSDPEESEESGRSKRQKDRVSVKKNASKTAEKQNASTRSFSAEKINPNKKTPTKRPAESNKKRDSKRRKIESSQGWALKPFGRKWSENDEIILLKEMIKCKGNNVADSTSGGLLDLIARSCHFDFEPNRNQVKEKINKMRQKYKKNSEKTDHSAMKPHDIEVFKLSRKLWGELGNGVASKARKQQEAGKFTKVLDAKPLLTYFTGSGIIGGDLDSAAKESLKEGFELVRESPPWDSGQRWTELRIKECELFVNKINLVKSQIELTMEKLDLMEEQVSLHAENLKALLSS